MVRGHQIHTQPAASCLTDFRARVSAVYKPYRALDYDMCKFHSEEYIKVPLRESIPLAFALEFR